VLLDEKLSRRIGREAHLKQSTPFFNKKDYIHTFFYNLNITINLNIFYNLNITITINRP